MKCLECTVEPRALKSTTEDLFNGLCRVPVRDRPVVRLTCISFLRATLPAAIFEGLLKTLLSSVTFTWVAYFEAERKK